MSPVSTVTDLMPCPRRYGATAEGFATFVEEQLGAYERCLAVGHSERECILAFEALGTEQEKVFFHCDQVCPAGMLSPLCMTEAGHNSLDNS